MNFLDYVSNSFFLNKLYPNGFTKISLQTVEIEGYHPLTFYINVYDKPAIEVPKYGVWGEDYNLLRLEFTADGIQSMDISNLQKNKGTLCLFECNLVNSLLETNFSDVNSDLWHLKLITDYCGFIFQGSVPYFTEYLLETD